MADWSSNTLQSSSGNQLQLQLSVWDSGQTTDLYRTIYYQYRLWTRYSLTDTNNRFWWSDSWGSADQSIPIRHGSGGSTTFVSAQQSVAVDYWGASWRFVLNASGFDHFGSGNVVSIDATYYAAGRYPTPPSPPQNASSSQILPSTIGLTWNHPATNNGAGVTLYSIHVFKNGDGSGSPAFQVSTTDGHYWFNDLEPGATYSFKVFAGNSAGWSGPSNVTSQQLLTGARVLYGGSWRRAVPYVRTGGVWRAAVPYVRVGGVWRNSD